MIIDCHCHAGKGDGLTGPWDTDASIQQYLRWASTYRIDKTVVFPAFHSNYAQANREVAAIVKAHPGRLLGFAFVHAERDQGQVFQMLKTAVQTYGFCGIKVHRHDARISREICETARAFHIPVLYDVVGEVSIVDLLAREYPDVQFIIPHLGSFGDDWRAQIALIDHLVQYPNIFTDTSGVRRFDILQRAVKRAGPHKFLFGSDGPWLHPGVELEKIYALQLPQTAQDLVLSGNFLRLVANVRRYPAAPRVNNLANTRAVPAIAPEPADPWLAEKAFEF